MSALVRVQARWLSEAVTLALARHTTGQEPFNWVGVVSENFRSFLLGAVGAVLAVWALRSGNTSLAILSGYVAIFGIPAVVAVAKAVLSADRLRDLLRLGLVRLRSHDWLAPRTITSAASRSRSRGSYLVASIARVRPTPRPENEDREAGPQGLHGGGPDVMVSDASYFRIPEAERTLEAELQKGSRVAVIVGSQWAFAFAKMPVLLGIAERAQIVEAGRAAVGRAAAAAATASPRRTGAVVAESCFVPAAFVLLVGGASLVCRPKLGNVWAEPVRASARSPRSP